MHSLSNGAGNLLVRLLTTAFVCFEHAEGFDLYNHSNFKIWPLKEISTFQLKSNFKFYLNERINNAHVQQSNLLPTGYFMLKRHV